MEIDPSGYKTLEEYDREIKVLQAQYDRFNQLSQTFVAECGRYQKLYKESLLKLRFMDAAGYAYMSTQQWNYGIEASKTARGVSERVEKLKLERERVQYIAAQAELRQIKINEIEEIEAARAKKQAEVTIHWEDTWIVVWDGIVLSFSASEFLAMGYSPSLSEDAVSFMMDLDDLVDNKAKSDLYWQILEAENRITELEDWIIPERNKKLIAIEGGIFSGNEYASFYTINK